MKQFTLLEPQPLGEADDMGIQTWWAKVEEDNRPVRFQKKRQAIRDRQVILAKKVEVRKSKSKGLPYLNLEGVELVDEEPIEATPVAEDEDPKRNSQSAYQAVMFKLEEIHTEGKDTNRMLRTLIGEGDKKDENVDLLDDEEPINIEDIPF